MPNAEDIKSKIAGQKAIGGLDGVRIVEALTEENDDLRERVKVLEVTGGKPVRVRRDREL